MKKPDMEELFATLPEIPEDFEKNCMKYASPVPIYYRRNGNYADCRCGKCNAVFMRKEKPTRGTKTNCMVCGTEGVYEWKRVTTLKSDYYTVVLVQCRTDGNLAMRHFKCINDYKLGKEQRFSMTEKSRYMLNLGDFYKYNRIYQDKWSTEQNGITWSDYTYEGWEDEIKKSNFKYFVSAGWNVTEALKAYARNPGLEMYHKIGLTNLRDDLIRAEGRSKYINRRGENLKKQLRLKNKQRINYLIQNNGDIEMLRILQMEEKTNTTLNDVQRRWLREVWYSWYGEKRINHILKYMTFTKMYNRMQIYEQQMNQETRYKVRAGSVVARYEDYISMREELGYDLTNTVYLFPKNLKEKHDQMVKEKIDKADELLEKEQEARYGQIRERYESLLEKYGYEMDGYVIRPAESATEIIQEGRTLHHCVGGDRYLEKHNKGQTSILFLRKKETPDIPYYTIEIKGTEILQWYGLRDKKPDKELIEAWLGKYIKHLTGKRMKKTA